MSMAEPLQVVNVRLPPELVARAEGIAEAIRDRASAPGGDWKERNTTRADVLRHAIDRGLDLVEKDVAPVKKSAAGAKKRAGGAR